MFKKAIAALKAAKAAGFQVTTNTTVYEGEDPADLAVERTMAAEALHVVAERLQGRERRIVVRRFGLDGQPPASRAEIGREMGISREMVRRLELRALAVVRESVLERSA